MTTSNLWSIVLMHDVFRQMGQSRSTYYANIHEGLVTKPVRIGARRVGLPQREVSALTAARVAGKSDDEIRALVRQLHDERKDAA